jgi:DNA-binding LytR/AlgR family response regulator
VDDDSVQLEYLKVLMEKYSNSKDISLELSFFHSAEEMIFENNGTYPYDMIVLDVQMDKINGIELAKTIREKDKNVFIAFVSGMANYVFDGYEVQAIRYILKPVNYQSIEELLDYVKTNLEESNRYLIISAFGEKRKINHDEIVYIESMGHYITIYLDKEKYEYKYNISDLCIELKNSDFVRVHRSYVVNIKHIEKITKNECYLINDFVVPLSRSSYKSVNEKFINYYRRKDI